jgi:hypothetical protein
LKVLIVDDTIDAKKTDRHFGQHHRTWKGNILECFYSLKRICVRMMKKQHDNIDTTPSYHKDESILNFKKKKKFTLQIFMLFCYFSNKLKPKNDNISMMMLRVSLKKTLVVAASQFSCLF